MISAVGSAWLHLSHDLGLQVRHWIESYSSEKNPGPHLHTPLYIVLPVVVSQSIQSTKEVHFPQGDEHL